MRGTGCARCRQTGLYGRTMACGMLIVNDDVRDAISRRADLGELRGRVTGSPHRAPTLRRRATPDGGHGPERGTRVAVRLSPWPVRRAVTVRADMRDARRYARGVGPHDLMASGYRAGDRLFDRGRNGSADLRSRGAFGPSSRGAGPRCAVSARDAPRR